MRIDATVSKLFEAVEDEVEIVGENGAIIGYFRRFSAVDPGLLEQLRREFPEERLQKMRKQTGGQTTAEVLARLESA